jgi:integrase
VKNAKPGMHADGAGLYLNVGPKGSKGWVLRYMLDGKAREMGLGPLHIIGLAEARERAAQARRLRYDGQDPIEARKAARAAAKAKAAAEKAAAMTFKQAAEGYIQNNRAAWSNAKHSWQWTRSLEQFVYPEIGGLPVAGIDTGHITKILQPLWAAKTETATRIRQRVEAVLDFAVTSGWRPAGPNPARWKGHLANVLPKPSKVARVEHHAALPWKEAPAFVATLGEQQGAAALALRFAILTAARTGEVIGARWDEIDIEDGLWIIPKTRMKARKEHRVPLAPAALAVLAAVKKLGREGAQAVFPGGTSEGTLSNMAMLALLRRMGRDDLTTHGFRSCFRDWVAEATTYQREIAEAALAHIIGGTEGAYQRGDLFEKRRVLMDAWAQYIAPNT